MARKKRNPDAEKLAESILNTYQPESVEDMQDVLKDVFGPLFEKMLQGELNNHLGYDAHSKEPKKHDNRRNGYGNKTLKTEDRKSTRLNSSHSDRSRMPSSA